MAYLLVLSQDNLALARAEAEALLGPGKLFANYLTVGSGETRTVKRLAYAHRAYKILFDCPVSDLRKSVLAHPWDSVIKKTFCVRFIGDVKGLSEAQAASWIWDKLPSPAVDLTNPSSRIDFLFHEKHAYLLLHTWENPKRYVSRVPHKRPGFSPVTSHPKFAKALVNLSGAQRGSVLVDPFCGVGGIVIEAGLSGVKAQGYDVDQQMIEKANRNLDYFSVRGVRVELGNAFDLDKEFEYLATDLPFGRSSRLSGANDIVTFYIKALKKIRNLFSKRAVVVMHRIPELDRVIAEAKIKPALEIEHVMHHSLTKHIIVLEK